MSLAARALRQDSTPVAALARSVGYTSESAFSNVFKRAVGVAPRRHREGGQELSRSGRRAITVAPGGVRSPCHPRPCRSPCVRRPSRGACGYRRPGP
ncbi:helix-turn-helix domain-containing protein [Streptomyces sp. NPDC008240]|uniref:helix-turn-helix domain-containing protein n=1 Tax=Streptomyces sp. NPDC008240 TaxID=3364822 RepID=UPI0036E1A8D0